MIDTTMESNLMPLAPLSLAAARRVLALAPHADDEVFGCGGALRLLAEAGASITVIVASDGTLGGTGDDYKAEALAREREAESRAAAEVLGYPAPIFWRLPDRGLRYGEALVARVSDAIRAADADLVFAPALTELHPDHQALALATAEALRRLGGERSIAFYEVSAPLLPNTLIDITAAEELKRAAMHRFRSQQAQQPYDERIAALNRYRGYTLGREVRAAEAFFRVWATELAQGLSPLFESALGRRRRLSVAVEGADVPLVSVIVRSMDRSSLAEALASVAAQTYPNIEVLVVNAKGGRHTPVTDFGGRLVVRLIETGTPLGRSRAANAGIEAASGRYVMFLDDDDLLLPDHVVKLAAALLAGGARVAYAGVRMVDANGATLHVFDEPWEPARLRGANYIPIHAVLFDRSLTAQGCRFDEQLDCFEDWDFWLQLSRHADFKQVPGVSAIYRHAMGSSGVFLAMPVQEHLLRRSKLFAKWCNLFSAEEWSETLHWYTQQRELLLKHIAGLEQHIAGLEQHNHHLDSTLVAARRQLEAVMNSRSWRLTAPLRRLVSLLRRSGG
jgi:LmbE family N-acetylglucosaminyl deacetylase